MDNAIEEVKYEAWAEMVHQRIESGLTCAEWCEQNNLNIKTYYYRLRKLRKYALKAQESKEQQLVEIQSVPAIKEEFVPAIIINTNKMEIKISNNTSDVLFEQLRRLINAK